MKNNYKIKNKMKEMMKNTMKWIKESENAQLLLLIGLVMVMAILVLTGLQSDDGMLLSMALVTGVEGGNHVVGSPLTTEDVRESGSDFLLNEVDQQIVKIRPMATPLDQLSRYGIAKRAGSMIVDYYNVDTKPTMTTVTELHEPNAEDLSNANVAWLKVENPDIFDVSDTILVKGVKGGDGKAELVLYVMGKNEEGRVQVMAVNGVSQDVFDDIVPQIEVGTELIRMGRAATELDVQTAQFESLPTKSQNFCQIFKMQVEQSLLQGISNKEIGWSLSDQEEAAIYDMRLGMEKSFLFGSKRKIYDPKKREQVMMTGGIWQQAGKEFECFADELNSEKLVELMREAFTGNAGSKRKVLIGGSKVIERLNKLEYNKVINAGETTMKWGIDFTEINSKFGRLYVVLSEVFDECGMENCGIIIDPEYIQKYVHLPFGCKSLDLKSAGVRNTDAIVLTEASCLVLRYPKAHMRIVLVD